MTYCIKFTILYEDCMVMKIIGNRPITAIDFCKLQKGVYLFALLL